MLAGNLDEVTSIKALSHSDAAERMKLNWTSSQHVQNIVICLPQAYCKIVCVDKVTGSLDQFSDILQYYCLQRTYAVLFTSFAVVIISCNL